MSVVDAKRKGHKVERANRAVGFTEARACGEESLPQLLLSENNRIQQELAKTSDICMGQIIKRLVHQVQCMCRAMNGFQMSLFQTEIWAYGIKAINALGYICKLLELGGSERTILIFIIVIESVAADLPQR